MRAVFAKLTVEKKKCARVSMLQFILSFNKNPIFCQTMNKSVYEIYMYL